jgi:hypothetical protein
MKGVALAIGLLLAVGGALMAYAEGVPAVLVVGGVFVWGLGFAGLVMEATDR